MPTYCYHCDDCDHQFDIFQHFTDDALTVCPNCHKPALRKIYTPVGIVFKGSGFYATDHRSPSGMNHTAAETPAAESGDKADSGTGEQGAPKPETKSETETAKPKKRANPKKNDAN